jgi:hypothetical protein
VSKLQLAVYQHVLPDMDAVGDQRTADDFQTCHYRDVNAFTIVHRKQQ